MKVMGVVLVVAGLALVGCTGEPDASIGSASSSATTTTTAPSSTSSVAPSTVTVQSTVTSTVHETVVLDTTPVLSHTGFGAIELGMTREQLVTTGLVGEPVLRMSAQCDMYEFKSGGGAAWIQDGKGLMAIMVKSGARTAEGLPVDISPVDPRLARTYPSGEAGPNGFSVWVNDDVFYFMSGSTSLARRGQACFN
ncbi:hypothetical protein ADK67_02310 [Saccharothrix sp. NRRL B-16348]|uniref:hypothetical protein n=1 Tax=Saccharothrix sp. NRRL B-16348 TaxID=1415542 RepID=UPI0006AFFB61|nr:hypothetical protein [Saccharothrix sp. NRRL B-16348]KOX35268.1 hypothetical protein ADK67_02310 [Saccharothrix sp. NRRL B-16348]